MRNVLEWPGTPPGNWRSSPGPVWAHTVRVDLRVRNQTLAKTLRLRPGRPGIANAAMHSLPGKNLVPCHRKMRQFVARKRPFIPEHDRALGK